MKNYFFFLIVLLFFVFGCSRQYGTCTLINKTTQKILKIQVIVCNQKIIKTNIEPGASIKLNFQITADSNYKIYIEFVNTNKLSKEIGYITNNVVVEDVIYIYDTEVVFEKYSREVK